MKLTIFVLLALVIGPVQSWATDIDVPGEAYVLDGVFGHKTDIFPPNKKTQILKADIVSPGIVQLTTTVGVYKVSFPSQKSADDFKNAMSIWPANIEHMVPTYFLTIRPGAWTSGMAAGILPTSSIEMVDSRTNARMDAVTFGSKMVRFNTRENELKTGVYGADLASRFSDMNSGAGIFETQDPRVAMTQISGKDHSHVVSDHLADEINVPAAAN